MQSTKNWSLELQEVQWYEGQGLARWIKYVVVRIARFFCCVVGGRRLRIRLSVGGELREENEVYILKDIPRVCM